MIRKWVFFFFLFLISGNPANSQTTEPDFLRKEQLENSAEKNETEPEDDDYEMTLRSLAVNRLNLNTVGEEELFQLQMLNALQVKNFLAYRKLLGAFISMYELQAVPGWDVETIKKILPYVELNSNESIYTSIKERWRGGVSSLLLRASQVLEKSKGYTRDMNADAAYYEGSAQKIFIRYTYNYKQLLQYGLTGEKDAGEPFFRGAQKFGFDFYSFHFFLRQRGILRVLALGDFTVNFGQGLIQWQGFSLTKSSQVLSIKRESAVFRPYHSAGEFNFHRGAAVGLQRGDWQLNLFFSYQKISTHIDSDSTGEDLFTSFQQSGYHRTAAEMEGRNKVNQLAFGGNVRYLKNQFHMGINMVQFHFNRSFQKSDQVYNLYSLNGRNLSNYSVDYSYTFRNLHFFGEIAGDQKGNPAFVQGVLLSVDEKISLSFLYRTISSSFHSLYSDAFTENSEPSNERGFYTGLNFKLKGGIQCNMYFDLYKFPWLKYRVDAPSAGRDLIIQVIYQPIKNWSLRAFYKNEIKPINAGESNSATHGITNPVRQRWKMDSEWQLSRVLGFSMRMEWVRLGAERESPQKGFLGSAGIQFRKFGISGSTAITLFETENYDTRIYMYVPDLLYNFSLPVFYGKGFYYFINLSRDLSPLLTKGKSLHVSAGLKWGQAFYPGITSIGSGLDEIPGNRKSEFKLQFMIQRR